MKKSLHLATKIFGNVHAVQKEKLAIIVNMALGHRIGVVPQALDVGLEDIAGGNLDAPTGPTDGIAYIPVHGTLVKRSMGMEAASGLTTYDGIQSQIASALADETVTGILLDVDSSGGEASGMFGLSQFIYANRGAKPMCAIANDDCYSAAYCVASAAERLFVTNTGGTGSIGCYMLHCDQSGADAMKGLSYTYIYSGASKIDGNPHEPLSDSATRDAQRECDRIRDMFVQAVARNRSVSADALLETEARMYTGPRAVPLLADAVGSVDDAIAWLRSEADMRRTRASAPVASVPITQVANKFGLSLEQFMDAARCGSIPVMPESECEAGLKFEVPANNPKEPEEHHTGSEDDSFTWSLAAHEEDFRPVVLRLIPEARRLAGEFKSVIPRAHQRGLARASGTSTREDWRQDRVISMLVVPYNEPSADLGGFVELYAPGCFREGLSDDPRALWNHNVDFVLGRQQAGTARFWEDGDGVHVECEAPNTSWADDLLVSMRRGDIDGSSAGFFILSHHWEIRDGKKTRVVDRALLREASVCWRSVYDPASASLARQREEADLQAARIRDEQIRVRLDLLRVS